MKRTQRFYIWFCFIWAVAAASVQAAVSQDSVRVFPPVVQWPQPPLAPFFPPQRGALYLKDSTLAFREFLYPFSTFRVRSKITQDSTGQFLIARWTYQDRPAALPNVIPVEQFKTIALAHKLRELVIKNLAGKLQPTRAGSEGQFREIIGAEIAGQRVSLRVRGNINILGRFSSEDRSQQLNVSNQYQSNTFTIDQQQAFKIQGKIGKHISIDVDEDSQRDFDFENAMKIHYLGDEDEIVQKIEAGNISLNLPGTNLAMVSGKSSGLFGVKAIMKVGALDITAVASLEKGKKNKKSLRGAASSQEQTIEDFEWHRNTYFFINRFYRRKFYPLAPDGSHYDPGRRITQIQVYKSVSQYGPSDETNYYIGLAYNHPNTDSTFVLSREFELLTQGEDYYLNDRLGYIRMTVPLQDYEVLAIAYRDTVTNELPQSLHVWEYDSTLAPVYTYQEGDTLALGIPPANDTLHLKLIKPDNPRPNQETWDLEFKNVYYLHAEKIQPDGFDLKLKYILDQEPVTEADDGTNFLAIFGLDQQDVNGNPGSDGIIDFSKDVPETAWLNFTTGELLIPFLNPFLPDTLPPGQNPNETNAIGEPLKTGGNPYLNNHRKYASFSFYNNVPSSNNYRDDNKFRIYVTYKNRSSTFNLGYNIIEGSDEVLLNGVPLQRGQDYTIDYFTGTLTILNDAALAPGANLEVKYEQHELFNLDKKVVLGTRAELKFGPEKKSYIGLTAIYFSKSSIDEKVRVGQEPLRNLVLDLNGKVDFKLPWLTKALDRLPLLTTDAPSRFTFQGEVARVSPNPNTRDNRDLGEKHVAYLDDFEGSRRETKLSILRRSWGMASPPLGKHNHERAFVYWFNPYNRVATRSIWPNKETNAQAHNDVTDILQMVVIPDSAFSVRDDHGSPAEAWGGIMSALSSGYYDQTESKFLEIWIRGETGRLHIDMGKISEDLQEPGQSWTVTINGTTYQRGHGILDTEDLPTDFGSKIGDGFVTADEDLGLDGWPFTHPDTLDQHPNWEKYAFDPTHTPIDYSRINGSEGNLNSEGGRYPDTEDLDGNRNLDIINAYYSISVGLDGEDYVAGRTAYRNGQPTGWKLLRIPLSDFQLNGDARKVSWADIRYVRLWLDSLNDTGATAVQIASLDIVGNEWQEEGLYEVLSDGREQLVPDTLSHGSLNLSVINTEDNPDRYNPDLSNSNAYNAPPKGVKGIFDPITGLRSKEQSLVFGVKELDPGYLALAKKRILGNDYLNLIHYATLKMFVHGWDPNRAGYETQNGFTPYLVDDTTSNLELRFRFGHTAGDYYEIRKQVFPGWDARNHISLNLQELAAFKLSLADSIWLDTSFVQIDSTGDSTPVVDTLGWDQLPPERQFAIRRKSGYTLVIHGNPSLSRIRFLRLGLYNGGSSPMTGEVWLDELRVTDIEQETAIALRASATLQLADIGNINVQIQKDRADFHNAQEQFGSGQNSLNRIINGSLNLGKLFPEYWGLRIPLNASWKLTHREPKYITGSDIRLRDLPLDLRDTIQSITTEDTSFNWNVAFSKATHSDFWLTKYTLDGISLRFAASQSRGHDSRTLLRTHSQYNAQFGYSTNLPQTYTFQPFAFARNLPWLGETLAGWEITPLPSNINFNLSMTQDSSFSQVRNLRSPPTHNFRLSMNRSLGLNWRPWSSFSTRMQFNWSNNLDTMKNNREAILKGDFGHLGNYSENYQFSWNPTWLDFLSPSLSYSSRFNAGDNIKKDSPGLDLSYNTQTSESFSLDLARLIGKLGGTTSGDRGGEHRVGLPPPTPGVPQKESAESLSWWDEFIARLQQFFGHLNPISVSMSQSRNRADSRVITAIDTLDSDSLIIREGHIQDTDWRYRLGLIQKPNFKYYPLAVNPFRQAENWNLNLNSGLKLGKNLSSDLTFSISRNTSLTNPAQGEVEVTTVNYLPSGNLFGRPADNLRSLGDKGLYFPSFTLRYTGLNKIEWLKNYVSNASLDMSYSGKRQERYEKGIQVSQEFTVNLAPLVRLNLQIKPGINTSLNWSVTRKITNSTNGTTNHTINHTITASARYTRIGGLTLPIPLMKTYYLKNNADFQFDLSYTSKTTYRGGLDENGKLKFGEPDFDRSLTAKPTVNYSFSRLVNGYFSFQYQLFSTRTMGTRTVKSVEFGVKVQIRG